MPGHKPRRKLIRTQVLRQLEFWLSDSNLTHDKFLRSNFDEQTNSVALDILLSFPRLRALKADFSDVQAALINSQQLFLSPDGTRVCRRSKFCFKHNWQQCTVYVQCVPSYYTQECVRRLFAQYGVVETVRFPRNTSPRATSTSAFCFVEFQTPAMASNTLQVFGTRGGRSDYERHTEHIQSSFELHNSASNDLVDRLFSSGPAVADEEEAARMSCEEQDDGTLAEDIVLGSDLRPIEHDKVDGADGLSCKPEAVLSQDAAIVSNANMTSFCLQQTAARIRSTSIEERVALSPALPDEIMCHEPVNDQCASHGDIVMFSTGTNVTSCDDVTTTTTVSCTGTSVTSCGDVTTTTKTHTSVTSSHIASNGCAPSTHKRAKSHKCAPKHKQCAEKGGRGRSKRRRRSRHVQKARAECDTDQLAVQVISLAEWLHLRSVYKAEQKRQMSRVKSILREAIPGGCMQAAPAATPGDESRTNVVDVSFAPGTVLHMSLRACLRAKHELRRFISEHRRLSGVRYVDAEVGRPDVWLRFCSAEEAGRAMRVHQLREMDARVLDVIELDAYWRRVVQIVTTGGDTSAVCGDKRRCTRGRERIMTRIRKLLASDTDAAMNGV